MVTVSLPHTSPAPTTTRTLDPAAMDRIVGLVATQYSLTHDQLFAKDRCKPVIKARAISYIAMHDAGASFTAIARYFNLDHSTVLHSWNRWILEPTARADATHALTITCVDFPYRTFPQVFCYLTRGYTLPVQQVIRAYILGYLLEEETYNAHDAALGALTLAQYPLLRARIERALDTYDYSQHRTRLTWHIQQLLARPGAH